MNITWSTYLGRYIGMPQNNIAQATDTKSPLPFYATDDLATQRWEDIGSVAENRTASWYRWFLDSGTRTTSSVVGRTIRSYCSFSCDAYTGEYADITIEPTSASALPVSPFGTKAQRISASDRTALSLRGKGDRRWTGDGFYNIVDASGGKALRVAAGQAGRAWGAKALGTANASPAAQWYLQEITKSPAAGGASVGTGTYRLVNRHSGLALTMAADGSAMPRPQNSDASQTLAFATR